MSLSVLSHRRLLHEDDVSNRPPMFELRRAGATMTEQSTIGIRMNICAPDVEEPAKLRHGVCEFLEGISKELCKMAYDNGFDTLAALFDMAREDAKRIRVISDDHLDRP